MRISDWSSDVCSSDLAVADADPFDLHPGDQHVGQSGAQHRPGADRRRLGVAAIVAVLGSPDRRRRARRPPLQDARRSEEHTSELQSLMRISYAVFCLKKKNYTNNTHTINICLIK